MQQILARQDPLDLLKPVQLALQASQGLEALTRRSQVRQEILILDRLALPVREGSKVFLSSALPGLRSLVQRERPIQAIQVLPVRLERPRSSRVPPALQEKILK